jgi:tetratricopeptide (TPR) repeat protein
MIRTAILTPLFFLLFSCKSHSQKDKSEAAKVLNTKAVQAIRTSPEQALVYLDSAIALDGTKPTYYLNRVSLLCSKGDYQKAIDDSKRAVEIQPDLAEARMLLAMLYDRTNHPELAKQQYEIALKTFTERLEKGSKNGQADKLNQAVALICLDRKEGNDKLQHLIDSRPNDPMLTSLINFNKQKYIHTLFP